MNKMGPFFDANLPAYQQQAQECNYLISLADNSKEICIAIAQAVDASAAVGYNALRDQVKLYNDDFQYISDVKEHLNLPSGFTPVPYPRFEMFAGHDELGSMKLHESTDVALQIDLQRKTFDTVPDRPATHKLHLQFEAVDTEELKQMEITVNGTEGIFKIGEGEANHYQIPNDKKLWESQLMIVCIKGKYYIRDLGIVHTSRIKIDKSTKIQLQQDTLVDLGKVVHYHFDKVTHRQKPVAEPSSTFLIMRPDDDQYEVEPTMDDGNQDPPTLRARPTWVSSDEKKDGI